MVAPELLEAELCVKTRDGKTEPRENYSPMRGDVVAGE